MRNQTVLVGFESPEYKERTFLDPLLPMLQDILTTQGCDPGQLTLSSTTGYSVVSLASFTVFRLYYRGKKHYFYIPRVFSDLIPPNLPIHEPKSDPKYIRLSIDALHSFESYTPLLLSITKECVNRFPKEWDCCSRYMECSDAKACVHPDKAFALGCGYRKILNSGRIFYGKNRNIDEKVISDN